MDNLEKLEKGLDITLCEQCKYKRTIACPAYKPEEDVEPPPEWFCGSGEEDR